MPRSSAHNRNRRDREARRMHSNARFGLALTDIVYSGWSHTRETGLTVRRHHDRDQANFSDFLGVLECLLRAI